MTEIVILYILHRYDATIYRISKIIDEYFFAYLKSSIGTINPALKRLEKLGCVEYTEKMTGGGMLSKIYSITPAGKKHFIDLMLLIKAANPYHLINTVKLALYCSDILNRSDLAEFRENLLNILELNKIKFEKGLKNNCISLGELQKQTVDITISEIENLIKLIRNI